MFELDAVEDLLVEVAADAVELEVLETELAEVVEDEPVDAEDDVSDSAEHLLVVNWHSAGADVPGEVDEKMAL